MKPKRTSALLSGKSLTRIRSKNDQRQKNWRQIGLRLAAIFLAMVFLASECSVLLPGQ